MNNMFEDTSDKIDYFTSCSLMYFLQVLYLKCNSDEDILNTTYIFIKHNNDIIQIIITNISIGNNIWNM